MKTSERPAFVQFLNELTRSRTDRQIGGVCGGLAKATDIPAWVYRAAFIALLIIGVTPLLYAALWIYMPLEPAVQETQSVATPPEPSAAH